MVIDAHLSLCRAPIWKSVLNTLAITYGDQLSHHSAVTFTQSFGQALAKRPPRVDREITSVSGGALCGTDKTDGYESHQISGHAAPPQLAITLALTRASGTR
jgi:hypothetical protein